MHDSIYLPTGKLDFNVKKCTLFLLFLVWQLTQDALSKLMFTVRKYLDYVTYVFREMNSILVSKTLEFLEQDPRSFCGEWPCCVNLHRLRCRSFSAFTLHAMTSFQRSFQYQHLERVRVRAPQADRLRSEFTSNTS